MLIPLPTPLVSGLMGMMMVMIDTGGMLNAAMLPPYEYPLVIALWLSDVVVRYTIGSPLIL